MGEAMRISQNQAQQIVQIIRAHRADASQIRLFGSRAQDSRRGGDLDLYFETQQPLALLEQADLIRCLEAATQLPVDLIIHPQGQPGRPIAAIAQATGIAL
jgi:predicted nucleotidyltransferase